MCMLTVFPQPDLMSNAIADGLTNGGECNPHGHGFAVVVGRNVVTGHSMFIGDAVKQFRTAYDRATGPALFHSRYATHGSKTLANVHPFPVRKHTNTFVAHNGIMPASAWPAKGDDRSDTRVFADDILPARFRRLDSVKVRDALGDWLKGNKVAILTTNRAYQRQLYLFGESAGNYVRGVWFSNFDHEDYLPAWRGAGSSAAGRHWWEDVRKTGTDCLQCGARNAVEYGYCTICASCEECGADVDSCQCYSDAVTS